MLGGVGGRAPGGRKTVGCVDPLVREEFELVGDCEKEALRTRRGGAYVS